MHIHEITISNTMMAFNFLAFLHFLSNLLVNVLFTIFPPPFQGNPVTIAKWKDQFKLLQIVGLLLSAPRRIGIKLHFSWWIL